LTALHQGSLEKREKKKRKEKKKEDISIETIHLQNVPSPVIGPTG
jgi:hypothetical protein